MFEKILCPVDFSSCSELALGYALRMAKEHASALMVMHVVPNVLADPDVYPYLAEPVLPSSEARDRALHQLGAFVHRALEEELSVDVVLESGDVVDQVVEKAERISAGLIVLGTHGRRGFTRFLLGSVAERLLRKSPCPVLSVSPSARVAPKEGRVFRKVLCPVDFSPASLTGLDMALSLAGEDGELTVVHVVEFYMDGGVSEAIAYDLEKIREGHREQAEARLREVVPVERCRLTRLETVVMKKAGPYKEILGVAERDEADLIVMGVAGRSAADMLFFGSTTNHVVRAATCPVLTTRPSE